jgi:light-regulated signal transduction histidine kinase (bacteriophytochrome)
MCIFRGPEHVVELANERMIQFWGKTLAGVINKPVIQALPEIEGQGFDLLLKNVYTTGEAFIGNEVPVVLTRNEKSETVFVNFVYEPYREADGSISGILAVAVEVTSQVIARHKIEEVVAERTKELADANSNLQRSNSELAQFAYIASHDLQEPLRKIVIFSEMLENSLGDQVNPQTKNYLNKINNSSLRMTTLIRDVLSYSELVKDTEAFQQVDLNNIIDNTKLDYDLLIEQKGASLTYTDLPVIQAIPLQMSQLFGNLLGNALKFTKKDIAPVITISAKKTTILEVQALSLNPNIDYMTIRFTDNGIGFKEEHAEQIFSIFQRLHKKSEFEGTGIGLAMCKKIALNHHGDINAAGSSEEGAVFNVILPVKQFKH